MIDSLIAVHPSSHPNTGAANCVLGTFLMRDLLGMPWLVWLLPVACSLGVLLLSGLFLEIPRIVRLREVRGSFCVSWIL